MTGSDLLASIIHPTSTVQAAGEIGGYILVTAVIFAECGLLIGFFLPGDSLLFTAGILAAQGLFNIWLVMALLLVAAIVGVSVGYAFGVRWGRKLFQRPDSRFFRKENLLKAEEFYHRHGGKTIILARFIPIVRTFAPIVAGVGQMSYWKFVAYNIVGGIVWVIGLVGAGYWLGGKISNIDTYLLPIIALIIFLSILPGLIHMLRTPARRQSTWAMIKSLFSKKS